MSCCGQKRQAVAAASSAPVKTAYRQPEHIARPTPLPVAGAVTLLCRDRSTTVVKGSVTGTRYQFAGAGSMQMVDRRDAELLIATGAFERVSG
jgi:hypothetical protein